MYTDVHGTGSKATGRDIPNPICKHTTRCWKTKPLNLLLIETVGSAANWNCWICCWLKPLDLLLIEAVGSAADWKHWTRCRLEPLRFDADLNFPAVVFFFLLFTELFFFSFALTYSSDLTAALGRGWRNSPRTKLREFLYIFTITRAWSRKLLRQLDLCTATVESLVRVVWLRSFNLKITVKFYGMFVFSWLLLELISLTPFDLIRYFFPTWEPEKIILCSP